jgi:Glycosyltransferase family 87
VNGFAVGTGPVRLLRAALLILVIGVCLVALHDLLTGYPWGVDVVIPLRAATRWLEGGQPYLASSFQAPAGFDAPFLYPPFVLPFLAPLTALPVTVVAAAWLAISAAAGVFACRRLAIPWLVVPLLFIWPPFTEGLLGGNVQVVAFAAFVAFLWRRPGPSEDRPDYEPLEHDPRDGDRPAAQDGLLAASVGTVKAAQLQPFVYLVARNWRAAAIGAAAVAGLALGTLPLVGIQAWFDWFAQLGRANDPAWILAGAGIARSLPWWVGDLLTVATLVAAAFVPSRHAGAWIGLLVIFGTTGLRVFGLLFALPAMLLVRREIGLVAALLMATYTFEGWWLGVLLVSGSLLAGSWPAGSRLARSRLSWLLEPRSRPAR